MSKTLDCGCVIYSAGSFTFCKLHASAPALLEALEHIAKVSVDRYAVSEARAAIEAAK